MPQTPKILIVDDNPEDVSLLEIMLRECGVPVRADVCQDGESALSFLFESVRQGAPPALVVLDYNLPRKNGGEVLREMKPHPALAGIPVLVITTSASPSDLEALSALGRIRCLTKPYSLDEYGPIIDAIRSVLSEPVL